MRAKLLKTLRHRSETYFNRKFVVIAVCFLIACIAWLQINLSRQYIETIPLKVNFINLPSTVFGDLRFSDTLMVEVEATGFSLMKYKMRTISVDYKKLKKEKHQDIYYFIPAAYPKLISRNVGENFKVLRTSIDTLQLIPSHN